MINNYRARTGHDALNAAVDRFYQRVTEDPDLAFYFAGMDMQKPKLHHGAVLGGLARYNGAGPRRAATPLHVEQWHFDAVADHLVGTLEDLSVPDELIGAVVERIAPLASQIVNITSTAAAAVD
jgi:hemoglobin